MAERVETASSDPKNSHVQRMIPPHTCRPPWIDRLLETVKDVNPDRITREFVSANVVASRNEGKVLAAVRFLGLIDDDGNVTPRLRALRVVGPEFTTNLAIVVQQAYSDLLNTVSIKSASHDRLVNFLMQKYSLGQTQAEDALRFFIHLASRAAMELNAELSKPVTTSQDRATRADTSSKLSATKRVTKMVNQTSNETEALATIDGPFGRIRIIDHSSLELARKLLELVQQKLEAPVGTRKLEALSVKAKDGQE